MGASSNLIPSCTRQVRRKAQRYLGRSSHRQDSKAPQACPEPLMEGVGTHLPASHTRKAPSQGQVSPFGEDILPVWLRAVRCKGLTGVKGNALAPASPNGKSGTQWVWGRAGPHSPSPSTAPWCARPSGGSPFMSGRRPAGSAPPRTKDLLVREFALSGALSPRGAGGNEPQAPRPPGSARYLRGHRGPGSPSQPPKGLLCL